MEVVEKGRWYVWRNKEPYDPLKAVNYGVKLSSLLLLIIQDLYLLYHIV